MIPNRAIGSSRPRADAKVLVEGRGCYLDDVPVGKVRCTSRSCGRLMPRRESSLWIEERRRTQLVS